MGVFTSIGVALGVSASMWGGAAAFGAGALAVGAVAAGSYALAGGFSGKDQGGSQGMQMPQAPDAPKLGDASKKANEILEERKRNMARSKSVMTNPLGVKDEANVVRKKLLGG